MPALDDTLPERDAQLAKLRRINAVLIERVKRLDDRRGSAHSAFQAAMALEEEVAARSRQLEQALEELRQKNEELAAARAAAEAANRAKTRFFSAASHDLLQPLSAARLFLATLSDTELDPLQAELVERAGTAFQGVEELMRAVLDISRLDAQEGTGARLVIGPVNLSRLLGRLIDEVRPMADAKGLDLRLVSCGATVESDPVYLRRILQNLLSNAIRYTDRGRVLVGVRHRGDAIVVEVHDTGIGIPADQQQRVFEEFHRAHPSTGIPGVGLGLSIVRRACEMLGHELRLDSAPGLGTAVRVLLRRSDRLAPSATAPYFSAPAPSGLENRALIVIENDPPLRRAYEMLLRDRWQMDSHIVASTEDALAVACRPEAILADYSLDGADNGLASIRRLRTHHRHPIPALLVTAHADADLARQCTGEDVALVAKPVRKRDLQRLLLSIMVRP